jgi:hypothetical protein
MNDHIDTSPEATAFTTAWWGRLLADDAKLVAWLQKLRHTEQGGYEDYTDLAERFAMDERGQRQFANIAADEAKHAALIGELLTARGHALLPRDATEPSLFWAEMHEHIVDLPTAAAVNYFGEALAAFRFAVILAHPGTPADVRELLTVVVADEIFHREALGRMAGDLVLERLAPAYAAAAGRLRAAK